VALRGAGRPGGRPVARVRRGGGAAGDRTPPPGLPADPGGGFEAPGVPVGCTQDEPIYGVRPLARIVVEPKTITDTVHGTVRLEPLTLELLQTLELKRLNSIR